MAFTSAFITVTLVEESVLPKAPVWDTPIPDQSNVQGTLPDTYDAAQHVSSNNGQAVTYAITPAVTGITIDPNSGLITNAAGTAIAVHSVTVVATNATGAATNPTNGVFDWVVSAAPVFGSGETTNKLNIGINTGL